MMNYNLEKRITQKEIERLFDTLSLNDDLPVPDYAVFKRVTKKLHSHMSFQGFEYVFGNIPKNHEKLRWHSAKADGEYLGKFDVIQLYSDDQEKVSALTLIHEYIHYRNKHKEIEVTEDKTHQEAIDTYKKLGY